MLNCTKPTTYQECNIMSKARLIALPYRKYNFYQEYMAHREKCHKFIQSLFIIKKSLDIMSKKINRSL